MDTFEGKSKYLYYFLIFAIFAGIFVRFWGLDASFLENDEAIYLASEIKLNHPSAYDPRFYLFEHPPVARWILGLPTRVVAADYTDVLSMPKEMFIYSYATPLKDVYVPVRFVSAIFGVLSIGLIFLISRNLFGLKAGLWSAALASLSFDLIAYSRLTLSESVFVGLTLFTLYFYLLYSQETARLKQAFFMFMAAMFLTLTLGTRTLTPIFLVPALILSQFLVYRKSIRESALFMLLVVFSVSITFYLVWPPEVRNLGQSLFRVDSVSDILKFSMPEFILITISRNSYLFAAGFLLLAYGGFCFLKQSGISNNTPLHRQLSESLQNSSKSTEELSNIFNMPAKEIKNLLTELGAKNELLENRRVWSVNEPLKNNYGGNQFNIKSVIASLRALNPHVLMIVLYATIIFFGLGFTKYILPRYLVVFFVPIIILAGRPLEKASKNNIVSMFFVLLILVNFYFFAKTFPYYSEYQNFSFDDCGPYSIICFSDNSFNHIRETKEVLSFLEERGNPPVISNEFNLLTFYTAEALPLTVPYSPDCNPAYFSQLANKYKYVVYYGYREAANLESDPYACPGFSKLPIKLIRTFGNYTYSDINPEKLNIKVYEITAIN